MSIWISVKDAVPKSYDEVLIYAYNTIMIAFFQIHNGGTDGRKSGDWIEVDGNDYDNTTNPSHWMPLPAPPDVDRRETT